MDARSELFVYIGSALATVTALFGAQIWYESYLDVAVVHAQPRDAKGDEKVAEVRAQEQQKLGAGRVPIDQAIAALAQRGRSGFPKLAPKPSDDLSAMSGWIHKPGFAPYVPRKPAAPAAPPAGTAVEGSAEGAAAPAAGAPAEGAAQVAAPGAAPAPAGAQAPAAPAPAAGSAEGAARPAGERAPLEATRVRTAPAGGTPSAGQPAR